MRGQRDNSGKARRAKTDRKQRDPRATKKRGRREAARGAGARSFSSQCLYEREKGGGGGEGKGGRRQEQVEGGDKRE